MKKATVKYQLIRDGELYSTVYDRKMDAWQAGQGLVASGWIKGYQIIPNKAIWLKA